MINTIDERIVLEKLFCSKFWKGFGMRGEFRRICRARPWAAQLSRTQGSHSIFHQVNAGFSESVISTLHMYPASEGYFCFTSFDAQGHSAKKLVVASYFIFVTSGIPPHYLGLKKYTKKCVNFWLITKFGQNIAFSMPKSTPAWKRVHHRRCCGAD